MNNNLKLLVKSKKLYQGNLYQNGNIIKKDVTLLKLSPNYYYDPINKEGYWDYPLIGEVDEIYVRDIASYVKTFNNQKVQVKVLRRENNENR